MARGRANISYVVKTFRFIPDLVKDIERVLFLTREGNEPKYPSLNNFVIVALRKLIAEERREVEKQGIVWEHLRHNLKQSKEEKHHERNS